MIFKKSILFILCSLHIAVTFYVPIQARNSIMGEWVQSLKNAFWAGEQEVPLDVLLFNEYDKKVEVLKLLDRHTWPLPQSIIQDNEWVELMIDNLLDRLDRTHTFYGKWALRKSITPHADMRFLLDNQKRIAYVCKNESLYNNLSTCMVRIGAVDDALLAYFNPSNTLHKQAESLYFSMFGNYLNKHESSLDSAYSFDVGKTILGLSTILFATGTLQTVQGFNTKDTQSLETSGFLGTLKKTVKGSMFLPIKYHMLDTIILKDPQLKNELYKKTFLEGIAHASAFGSFGDLHFYLTDKYGTYSAPTTFCLATWLVLYDVSLGLQIRHAIRYLTFLHETTQKIKKQLSEISQIFAQVKQIVAFAKADPLLAQWRPIIILESCLNGYMSSPDLQELIPLLEDPIFDIHNNSWRSRGKILLAHKLLLDVRVQLIPALQAIGQVDALLSVVTLYKEHKNKHNTFCFATYSDNQQTGCDLQDLWHPLITKDEIVTNSVLFGLDNGANKAIFTGPNGGGKSTIMQAIAYSFILGQSWGIVPATSATITPLSGIRTALNPHANVKKNLSTFMAEKLRIDQINKFIANYAEQPILVVLDEPFKGTVESESAYRINEFGMNHSQKNYCMMIMATHLEKPIYLEEESGHAFNNYQLEFEQPTPTTFNATYRLLPGPALWWFNNEAQRRAYIDCLLFDESLFADC